MSISVVPMQAAHIAALAEIEKQCFAAPWSAAALAEELENPTAVFLTAVTDGGDAVGYAGMQVAAGEGYFTNVAVSPAYRRQGVADKLLDALAAYGRSHALFRLTLEVRVSNAPALALYEKHGFVRDGVRPRFYSSPTEDAAILSLVIGESNPYRLPFAKFCQDLSHH